MNRLIISGVLSVVVGLNVANASACSVTGEYVRPTNFELVQLADAIAVADHSPIGEENS